MAKLLQRLDFVHKKPKSVPAKADEAVQRCFVEHTLKPLMDAACPEAPLSFVDATHPAYTGRPAHGWMRRGHSVELKSNHGRCHLNLNGALSWRERTLIHRQEETITSAAMIRLFEDLCARHAAAGTITVVLDNARSHRSQEIKASLARPDCRLRLVYLPAYAPNLNLIERFWHLMKRKVLFNKAYAKFALFPKAFDEVFANLATYAQQIETLITDRFHFIRAPNTRIPSA